MTTVLDDVTDEKIDAQYICRRVDDWEDRVRNLFVMIRDWLPEGWSARDGAPVRMHEEMMREYEVPARQIPTLRLASNSGSAVWLKPRGLWIIGANGRIDMKCADHHYFIVDIAEIFKAPDWRVVRTDRRRDLVELTEDWLKQALP